MAGTIQEINIAELVNYFENPRHAIANSEEDTLKKLFEAVGNQYMLNLAEDVQKNGLLGNQQIVVVYAEEANKYVVYEGNRRVAAIKLLLNPDWFSFLDRATIDKAKRIGQLGGVPEVISCYVTDEQEAFFIMERLHSGEDKGRGIKQWTPREKEAFKVRQSHEKNLSYLIDFYVKKHFDGLDITTILPFTTIQRIFNNREIKKQIGLDISNERTFTSTRMQLVIDASEWIVKEAEAAGIAVTRLFNKARAIEDKLLPWIQTYMQENNIDSTAGSMEEETDPENQNGQGETADPENDADNAGSNEANSADDARPADSGGSAEGSNGAQPGANEDHEGNTNPRNGSGGSRNLPYFFQGLNYGSLDPNDADTHGVSAVCRELQLFSDRRLVSSYPIASTFLVRSIIEQSIIYYSKKHNIQGQNKLIWENIQSLSKLSKIIDNYKRNLHNYITDATMRQYFTNLFGNYEDNVDPLNWVVHKPAEFQLDANTLVDLPRKGLLALINFMIS